MDSQNPPGGGNVPSFLTKLWCLVEDPETRPLVCWSPEGRSFHVYDQSRFSRDVLPKYYKHSNMASFIRQLNMYGFRKVVHMEQGGLVKPERDDTEFQHPNFIRGQEHLLDNIKRKATNNLSAGRSDEVKIRQDNLSKLLTDVQMMRGKQESVEGRLLTMTQDNEALWREVTGLRQKHSQQQKVVSKLIQFLISLVQSNRILGVKRKIPLMLNDGNSAHSLPKFGRRLSLERVTGSSSYPASMSGYTDSAGYSPQSCEGPIICDVTEVAQSCPSLPPGRSLEGSPVLLITEEPPDRSPGSPDRSPGSPDREENVLSPSTFMDSILQENDDPAKGPDSQQPAPSCLSVARLDTGQMSEVSHLFPSSSCCSSSSTSLQSRSQSGNELSDHLDILDSGLDSLQSIFSMDSGALLDLFSPSLGGSDLPLPDLDSSLASIQDLLTSQDERLSDTDPEDAGKQLVHYTGQPRIVVNAAASELLPVLLELEDEDDPSLSLLSWDCHSKSGGSGLP